MAHAFTPCWRDSNLRILYVRILAQIEREKMRDPWNYAREFGAEFLERDQGSFFEADCVEACVV